MTRSLKSTLKAHLYGATFTTTEYTGVMGDDEDFKDCCSRKKGELCLCVYRPFCKYNFGRDDDNRIAKGKGGESEQERSERERESQWNKLGILCIFQQRFHKA